MQTSDCFLHIKNFKEVNEINNHTVKIEQSSGSHDMNIRVPSDFQNKLHWTEDCILDCHRNNHIWMLRKI